jgi:TPR repeat protein
MKKSSGHKTLTRGNSLFELANKFYEKSEYDKAIILFNSAVQHKNVKSMYALACHYYNIVFNLEEAVKYYLIAINHNHVESMFELAFHYYSVGNSVQMIKYYELASKHGCIKSMHNLGSHYIFEKEYNKAKIYYGLAAEKGDVMSMNKLGYLYQHYDKNYDEMIKYHTMAIQNNSIESISDMIDYYFDNKKYIEMKDYCLKGIESDSIRKRIIPYLYLENSIWIKLIFNHNLECAVCKECVSNTISLNCYKKDDHNYCKNCFMMWYGENTKKCMLCTKEFDFNNIVEYYV